MNLVNVGFVASAHGLDGKLKVLSDERLINEIFKVGNKIYINDKEYIINSFQTSGKYIIISLKDYLNIDLITPLIKQNIYIDVAALNLNNNYLLGELIDSKVIDDDTLIGEITDIRKGLNYDYVVVKEEKEFLIPLIAEYVIKFNREEKVLLTKGAKDLIF